MDSNSDVRTQNDATLSSSERKARVVFSGDHVRRPGLLSSTAPADGYEASAVPQPPPVLQKTGQKAVFAGASLKVSVVFEDVKNGFDRMTVGFVRNRKVLAIPSHGIIVQSALGDSRLGQQVECDSVEIDAEHRLQASLVVIQTDLAARSEHVDGIHDIHVVQGC